MARVDIPAWLSAELISTRPSPVPREVYETGPTAMRLRERQMQRWRGGLPMVVTVDGEQDTNGDLAGRHAADPGEERSLCGRAVFNRWPRAHLSVVTCSDCEQHMPLDLTG